MYAIVEIGGKQYRVSKEDVIFIDKIEITEGETITFDKVLAIGDGTDIKVGTPYLAGAKVCAKSIKNGKSKKILVFKYKPKKGYRRRQGHRQPYSKIQIESITA